MVEIETPTDRAGEELVQNVKAHVRSVLNVPLQHQSAKAREVIVSQVTMAAVQACFAFLSAHDSYRNPRPLEFEDLDEDRPSIEDEDRPDDEDRPSEFEDELPKAKSPHNDGGVT